MRALGTFVIILCTLVFTIIGGFLVSFLFNVFNIFHVMKFVKLIYQFENINLIIGSIGLFLVLASILTAQISIGRIQRERTIAFSNPNGEVTVSLNAIEEFIKRLSMGMNEIKELRSNVIAGKKGIEVNTRVSLWADANIPETTNNIQDILKTRLQEILGIEDPITIRIHVVKIIPKEKKKTRKEEVEAEEQLPPFRGSIEYGKER
ncbi:MAG: alkaline shock response membrane anchor protein AmaP [Candidatus Omnitrophota bacterium]